MLKDTIFITIISQMKNIKTINICMHLAEIYIPYKSLRITTEWYMCMQLEVKYSL